MPFLIVLCVMKTTIVHAEIKTFIGVSEYIMNDFENTDIAKQRTQQNAELDAQKKAATYLKNFSETIGTTITDDEISAITNNTIVFSNVEIESVSNELSNITYKATIEAQIDTNGIEDFLKRDDKDKVKIIDSDKRLKAEIRKNNSIVEIIKAQYNRASSQAEKDVLCNQIKIIDLKFLINRKHQEVYKFLYVGDKDNKAVIPLTEASDLSIKINEEYHKWAIPDYDKAIELDPDDSDVYTYRGVDYNNLGQYNHAIQDLNKALELDPSDPHAHYNRGIVYSNLEQYEQALPDFNQAIKFYPYSHKAQAYLNRGLCYQNLECYEQAVQDFDKAIKLDSNDVVAYNLRGYCYFNLEQYNFAIADFNKVIELNPNNDTYYFYRGLSYFKLAEPPKGTFKNFDKSKGEYALKDFTKAIEINPNDAINYFGRGICYFELEKYGRAVKDFTKAIEVDPNYVNAYFSRGHAYVILNQYKKALSDLNKYIEFVPDSAEAYSWRGYCYFKLRDTEKWHTDSQKANELSNKI